MYGDIISLADALLISVIAMFIVFLAVGAIYAILMIFRKVFSEKQHHHCPQCEIRQGLFEA